METFRFSDGRSTTVEFTCNLNPADFIKSAIPAIHEFRKKSIRTYHDGGLKKWVKTTPAAEIHWLSKNQWHPANDATSPRISIWQPQKFLETKPQPEEYITSAWEIEDELWLSKYADQICRATYKNIDYAQKIDFLVGGAIEAVKDNLEN